MALAELQGKISLDGFHDGIAICADGDDEIAVLSLFRLMWCLEWRDPLFLSGLYCSLHAFRLRLWDMVADAAAAAAG